ncbi:MAG TPA: hypothetical protein DHV37_05825 [Erysipelotrichaceae bacterium]|nr:hypothetical protein [Erysipelotrichaceae bacterium]
MAKYTNSPLVVYTKKSPNHSGQKNHDIIYFTPHCVVGQVTIERLGEIFARPARKASSNYGIDKDGRIGLFVDEKNRSWCTSSSWNDNRAITVEVASDATAPYAFREKAYNALVDLLVDCCQRNGKNKVIWWNDKNKTLNYTPKSNEMVLTVHRWFAAKACPGEWMMERMGKLANEANKRLQKQPQPAPTPTVELYRVRLTWDDAKSQKGAFKDLDNAKKCCDKNPGYSVFNSKGEAIYTSQKPNTKYGYTIGGTYTTVPLRGLNVRQKPSLTAPTVASPLKKCTKVVCKDVQKVDNNIWMQISQGWICAKFGNQVYVK